jgi:uncharacterized membrane protein
MSTDSNTVSEPTIFSAVITPNRSLDRVGFIVLMSLVSFVSFVGGLVFFIAGAWPVVGFFGLDVALLYWAFKLNYAHAKAYEEVTVTAAELKLRKVSHRGEVREFTLNPLWTKLDREAHADFGLLRLFLVSRGRRCSVANYLGPQERESFAEALSAALNEAKRGPMRTLPQQSEIGWEGL